MLRHIQCEVTCEFIFGPDYRNGDVCTRERCHQ